LRREAIDVERHNVLHPTEKPRLPYLTQVLAKEPYPVVAASDYMKVMADQVGKWVPGGVTTLGTDGFGRSEAREELRRFFEVDAESISIAALYRLSRKREVAPGMVSDALKRWDFSADKPNPART
jgi:pyruvate dehydrogenase E1 component